MAPATVVDLTRSPSPESSPESDALAAFLPRKEKVETHGSNLRPFKRADIPNETSQHKSQHDSGLRAHKPDGNGTLRGTGARRTSHVSPNLGLAGGTGRPISTNHFNRSCTFGQPLASHLSQEHNDPSWTEDHNLPLNGATRDDGFGPESEILRKRRVENFHNFHEKNSLRSFLIERPSGNGVLSTVKTSPSRLEQYSTLVDTIPKPIAVRENTTHEAKKPDEKVNSGRSLTLARSKRSNSVTTLDDPKLPPQKRHHIDEPEQNMPNGQSQSNGQAVFLGSRFQLVDITENSLDERVTFSDGSANGVTGTLFPKEQDFRGASTYHEKAVPAPKPVPLPPNAAEHRNGLTGHGYPYSTEEDNRLKKLKEIDQLSWEEIVFHFPNRTRGSLQVQYSSKLKGKRSNPNKSSLRNRDVPKDDTESSASNHKSLGHHANLRRRRKATSKITATDGFISWVDVKSLTKGQGSGSEVLEAPSQNDGQDPALLKQDRVFPKLLSSLIRQRELGGACGRAWTNAPLRVPEELKERVFDCYTRSRYYHGTSGDVISLSWSSEGKRFAAGSIAISDSTSMQYNMHRNLLLGDHFSSELRELVDHHVSRPIITDSGNVNALHSMRESQDPRLFLTVTATAFSPDRKKLFTAGRDKMVRQYSANKSLSDVQSRYAIEHPASVDLLAVSNDGLVATGCHLPSESINVYHCKKHRYTHHFSFSPNRGDLQSSLPIFPSSLKWGTAYQHRHLLLAGFSNDSEQDERRYAGETCLWDVDQGERMPIGVVTRNVFDLAWNPTPSSTSIAFAVASDHTSIQVDRGIRSVIQCFNLNQDRGHRVLAWQCPAIDINDVVFCPHDDRLIAAGATDGMVYVWDQRFASRSHKPLHTLSHGDSLNVLPHERDRETADTGVRFLSWGATKSRLYSGSSDGIVKVWNPDRSPENAHVDDIATSPSERSAIMSGAFSPDYMDLLVGTENGRINLFSIGKQRASGRLPEAYKLLPAPASEENEQPSLDVAKSLLESGKIVVRPCGAMPFRQAVQGPNYDGPLLAPSSRETSKAQETLQQALYNQHEISSKMARDGVMIPIDDEELNKANQKVKDAQMTIRDHEDRLDFHAITQPKAEAFQRSLQVAEKNRRAQEAHLPCSPEPCQLACRALPIDEEDQEPSGRSDTRVPGFLRFQQQLQTSLSCDDDNVLGNRIETICPSCSPRHSQSKQHKNQILVCPRCSLKKLGLTAVCVKCSAPTRPAQTDNESQETRCERCYFACFRCCQPATVSPSMNRIICHSCGLGWEANVLGYELKAVKEVPQPVAAEKKKVVGYVDEEFGMEEIEHYASRWGE